MAKVTAFITFCTIFGFCISLINGTSHTLTDVINALDKLVGYCKSNYQNLNFDAHFGLRVVEGQFKLILSEYNDGKHRFVPAAVMTHIRYLAGEATKIANMAVPHLLEFNPHAFNAMKYQVNRPWSGFHSHRIVYSDLQWDASNFRRPSEITEEEKNKCVAELTVGNENSNHKCSLSADCLQRMTSIGQRGFSLQHQIFYSSLVEQVGCKSSVEEYLQAQSNKITLAQLQLEFCSNVYYDLMRTTSYYGIQPSFKILFLQIEFNCPSLGFFQLLNQGWLDLILSWQTSSGCIATFQPDVENKESINIPQQIVVGGNFLHKDQQFEKEEFQRRNDKITQFDHPLQSNNENIGPPMETEQRAWFPNSNYRGPNKKYDSHLSHKLDSKFDNTNHQHLLIPENAREIAHGNEPQSLGIKQSNFHIGNSDVKEVIHSKDNLLGLEHQQQPFELDSQHNFQNNSPDKNPGAQQFAYDPLLPVQNNNNLQSKFQRRSLLETNELAKDEDGYFFDRDKHIGANDTNKNHTYLYYYPMYEQIKRMKEFKEKRKLKLAEKKKLTTTTRKLLKDIPSAKCHMQMTGLATSALVMYVRYFIDPGSSEFHGSRLNKPDYDFGGKDSFEDDILDAPVYAERRNNYNTDKELSALKIMDKFRNNGVVPRVSEFKPLYFGDVRRKLHPEENDDYVRRAENHRELIDKAFDIKRQYVNKINNVKSKLVAKTDKKPIRKKLKKSESQLNPSNSFNSFLLSAQFTTIHKQLKTELGNHLIVIIIISTFCIFILFRHMRFKHRYRHRTKYV